jgi:hypothetical protein
MKHIKILNLRNIILICSLSFQFVWVIFLILAKYDSQVKKGEIGLDFLTYYSAGYIARYISPSQMYDLDFQRQIQDSIVSLDQQERFYPYNHPPILAPLLELAVSKVFLASYLRWVVIMIMFLILSLGILAKLMSDLKWNQGHILLTLLSGFLFYPAMVAFLRGQDSSFLLLGVSLWAFGLITSNNAVAGLGLALVMIRPQIALVLALPFLFKKQRVWWWFALWAFIILILSCLYIGPSGLLGFARVLIFSGQGLGFDIDKMATFMGAILRWQPGIDPGLFHTIGYIAYGLSITFLCGLWARSNEIGFKQINIAILTAIIFVPHLHGHDLIILLIPAIGAISILSDKKILEMDFLILLPMILSLLLIINDLFAMKLIIYLLVFSLALISWKPDVFNRVPRLEN